MQDQYRQIIRQRIGGWTCCRGFDTIDREEFSDEKHD